MGYVFPLEIPRNFLEFLYSGLFGYITSKSSLTFLLQQNQSITQDLSSRLSGYIFVVFSEVCPRSF